jgi:hypothetical protein
MPIRLSVCLFACMHVYMSVCLSVYQLVCMPVCMSVCLSACLPVCLSACLTFCLSACLPVCLSVCLSVVCLSVCLSVYTLLCISKWSTLSIRLCERSDKSHSHISQFLTPKIFNQEFCFRNILCMKLIIIFNWFNRVNEGWDSGFCWISIFRKIFHALKFSISVYKNILIKTYAGRCLGYNLNL